MSNVYLVERSDENKGYDEVHNFVVVAKNPRHARQLCAEHCSQEGMQVWYAANTTLLAKGALIGEACIVLRDFNAG